MGRYNFAPQRVHQAATRLLETQRIATPPPWYDTIGTLPPSARLVRPALQGSRKRGKKASRLFEPVKIKYVEDGLRADFFGDHPWELARPRIVVENDGRDYEKHDWSRIEQRGKQLDGESVVQRQKWLMDNEGLARPRAYDVARKEFYAIRHREDVERRVAKEEALHVGAHFGLSPLEIGMQLEDKMYEEWRAWALGEIEKSRQLASAAYTGQENAEAELALGDPSTEAGLDELGASVPGTSRGQEAFGDAAVRP